MNRLTPEQNFQIVKIEKKKYKKADVKYFKLFDLQLQQEIVNKYLIFTN